MSKAFWWTSRVLLAPPIRLAWRVRIEGRQYIPKKGPAVIVSNHLSFLDHFVLPMATTRPIYFVSKAEHFESPVKRWFFGNLGIIPLKRGAGDKEALERALQVLREGELFGIYPEGTRSLDGKLHKGRTGGVRIALMAQVPIVPAAMIGTFEALPKGKSFPRFSRCKVRLGQPIDLSRHYGKENDREALRAITDDVMRTLAALSGQEYVDAYQFNPEYAPKDADREKSAGEMEDNTAAAEGRT